MIISITSWGSLAAGDKGVVAGEATPERVLWILARHWPQDRFVNELIAVIVMRSNSVMLVKQHDYLIMRM